MDARFGELSRAMRNRAIEIFLDPLPSAVADLKTGAVIAKPEAPMQRFSRLSEILEAKISDVEKVTLLESVALDNLAWSDLCMLSRYAQAIKPKQSRLTSQFNTLSQQYLQIYHSAEHKKYRTAVGAMLDSVAAGNGLSQQGRGFKDAQVSDRALPYTLLYVLIVVIKFVDCPFASKLTPRTPPPTFLR